MTTSIKYEVEQLYHYTSLNTLHAILQNKTIRLTDYRFLNDMQELFFATEKLKKYIQGNPTINEREELLTAVQNIESGKISKSKTVGYLGDKILISPLLSDTNYYVLSLSNARDNIAMWKMYAPEGCCMKFNSQKLFEFFYSFRDEHLPQGLTNIIRGQVHYGDDQQMSHMVNFMSSDINKLMIYYNILQYCLLQKDKAFAYEQEYRIALPFESEYLDDSCSREFIISETLIKPQIEFKNFPISEILEEVIISPFVKSELTHMGVQELLKANGISPDIVLKSNILIR